jgi:hypothetical protein
MKRHIIIAAALASLTFPPIAQAQDQLDEAEEQLDEPTDGQHHLRVALGGSALGSTWGGDAAAYTGARLGFRFIDLIGPYAALNVGYGVVDDRMLTAISLGGAIWLPELGPVRPFGRLGLVHQHEESLSVVADDFGSALFGVGDGIRHRAGGEAVVGIDFPVWEDGDWEIFGAVDGELKLFPDDLGPVLYAGGGLNLGMNYTL